MADQCGEGVEDEVAAGPVGDDDPDAVGQQRCEVLAALGLAVTAAVMVRGYAVAGAFAAVTTEAVDRPSAWELVETAAGASSLYGVQAEGAMAMATLVLAYLLVVNIGPGSWIGAVGTRVLQGVVAIGALLTLSGGVATIAVLRRAGQFESLSAPDPAGNPDPEILTTVLDRGGSVLPLITGAALATYLAWLAWGALDELRREPSVDEARAVE